jgi:hypothetical protein
MSFIECKIPGSEIYALHEDINCVLNGRTPSVAETDTLQLKYNIEFPQFDGLADKLRSLTKIIENPAVVAKYEVDQSSLAELKECLVLLDFIHQRCQCDSIENLIARISIFDEKEKAA